MKLRSAIAPLLAAALASPLLLRSSPTSPSAPVERTAPDYGAIPLSFEQNVGQHDPRARYVGRGPSGAVLLHPEGARFVLSGGKARSGQQVPPAAFGLRAVGARAVEPVAEGEQAEKVNYYLGSDRAKWHEDVPTFAKVRYPAVYPGVDLVYYGNGRELEYDFVVAPGADASQARIAFDDVERVAVDATGDLRLTVAGREVVQRRPVVYQEIDGRRQEVAAAYVVTGEREVAVTLGERDRSRATVIDPVLVYATYLGGSSDESRTAFEVDAAGYAYVAGTTYSADFPTFGGQQMTQPAQTGPGDGFVVKVTPSGTARVYSTYLGGAQADSPRSVAFDGSGAALVGGTTGSTDFPTTAGVLKATSAGGYQGFLTKLSPTGALSWSTYYGVDGADFDLRVVGVDGAGNVFATGQAGSAGAPPLFATTGAANTTWTAGASYVAKVNADGQGTAWSTYLPGDLGVADARVNGAGEVIVLGRGGNQTLATVNADGLWASGDFQYPAFVRIAADGASFLNAGYIYRYSWDTYYSNLIVRPSDGLVCLGGSVGVAEGWWFGASALVGSYQGGTSDGFVRCLQPGATGVTWTANTFLGSAGADSVTLGSFGPTGDIVLNLVADTQGQLLRISADCLSLVTSIDLPTRYGVARTDGAGNYFVAAMYDATGAMPLVRPIQSFAGATDVWLAKYVDLSLSPTSGKTSGGTVVTFTGAGFADGMQVTVGGVSVPVTVVSATSMTATMPQHGATGGPLAMDVVVTWPDGTVATIPNGFSYVSSISVTSFSPASGPAAGGTTMTITGTDFMTGVTVKIGVIDATSVTRNSDTSITLTTPTLATGAHTVVVTNPDGNLAAASSNFTAVPAPTITSMTPSAGPLGGGTTVTIIGANFDNSAGFSVKLDGVALTPGTVTPTTIVFTTPAHAAGQVSLVVTNPDGQTASSPFTYGDSPNLASVAPVIGPTLGGTTVTLTGSNFTSGPGFAVKLGGVDATVGAVTATSATVTTPAHAAGVVDVRVTNPDGQSDTLASSFTFLDPPTISSVSPAFGPAIGGSSATITGGVFVAGATVTIGGADAPVTALTAATLVVDVPAHAAGAVDVVVTNADGQSVTRTGGYTYQDAPTIAAVAPASGPTAGGTQVTITGTGFQPTTSVRFGLVDGAVSAWTATSLTVDAPAHAPGAVDVVVKNTDGQSVTAAGAFTYVPPPAVSAVTPDTGTNAGGTSVTLAGSDFTAGLGVTFGGAAATVTTVTATSVVVTTPAHADGVVDVVVTNADGQSATAAGAFTYAPIPVVTGVSPSSGPTSGGTTVTLAGFNFATGLTVTVGGTAAGVAGVTSTSVSLITPAHAAGSADLVVTNPDGRSVTVSGAFTYADPPSSDPGGGGGCGCATAPPVSELLLLGSLALVAIPRRRREKTT